MRRNDSGVFSVSLSILLAVNAFLVTGTLAGCDANPARPIVASGDPSVVTGDTDLSDPIWACVVGKSDIGFFPLVCSPASAPCIGGSEGTSCNATGCTPSVFHVMCGRACAVDADCPVPLTGTARPSCSTDFHYCRLPCSADSDCPTGFTCQDGTKWIAITDSAGNTPGLPQMCMQTITVQVNPDGGL